MTQFAQRLRFDLTIRSRVTSNCLPTSSSVWSVLYRYRNAYAELLLHARSGQPDVVRCRAQAFGGRRIQRQLEVVSSMKSPRCESSSSPIGVSWRLALWRSSALCGSCLPASDTFSQFFRRRFTAHLLQHLAEIRLSLLIVSIICTGIRMVRPDPR